MPFKYDAQGNIVTSDHNGKKLPVFVNAKGEEAPFDADGTVEAIARLNSEAKGHREAKEALETKMRPYLDAGIDDPVKAKKALELTANLDAKKLVDAGEIERVRAEIGAAWQTKLEAEAQKNSVLAEELYSERVGGAFSRSKFISERGAVPADIFQARFGSNFGMEDGKVYAVDAAGNKLYSRSNPGVPADFDEALGMLVEAYPYKDTILKGTGASGGGAQGGDKGGANGGGGGGTQKGNLGGSRDERRAAIASRFPELGQQGS